MNHSIDSSCAQTFLHLLHCRDCAGPAFCPELILCEPVRLFPPGGCLKVFKLGQRRLVMAGWLVVYLPL